MRRPSAAFILSFLALLGAWGGPAIAGKLITSRDVKDRSLTGRDLRSNTITGRVVKNLSGRDILSDSLDGTDIAEETLGTVARARSATEADRTGTAERAERAERAAVADSLAGARVQRLHFARAAGAEATVLELGGLTLNARCSASGALSVSAATAGPSWIRVSGSYQRSADQVEPLFTRDDDFRPGESFNVLPAADNVAADLVYVDAQGGTVTATFLAEHGIAASRGFACLLSGTAVQATG